MHIQDAQIVRYIRNEIRGNLTNNSAYISSMDQHVWFARLPQQNKLFLYRDVYAAPVGYGYINVGSDGRKWGTLGVLPEFQNNGYGQEIYNDLIASADNDLWIEIFTNNNPSLVAALKCGFVIQTIGDKTIILRSENKV